MTTPLKSEQNNAESIDKAASLLERVAAWWASEDSHQLAEKDTNDFNKDQQIHVNLDKFEIEKWTDQRVEILELLWGQGNRLPGDEEFNLELFRLEGLDSKSKILDIAVGLGSCARLFAKKLLRACGCCRELPKFTAIFNNGNKARKIRTIHFSAQRRAKSG